MSHDAAGTRSAARALLPLALATGLCAVGYGLEGPAVWTAGGAVVPGAVWAATHRRNPGWAADASLVLFVALASLGLWLGVGAGWMAGVVVAALGTWDLAYLERRLALAGQVQDRSRLETQHLFHLLPVLATGLALALLGAWLRIKIGFLPALILGVVAIAGLARAIAYLVRAQD